MTSPAIGANAVLPPGDLRRPVVGRAVRAGLLAAAVFEVFTLATKQIHPVYAHVPWADDPYDTFVSFALFFVPLAGLAAGARLALCRTSEALPVPRLVGVVRATWLAVGVSLATLAADWAGVVRSGSLDGGHDAIAAASVLALAITTAVVLVGAIALARVHVPPTEPILRDGIADALALTRRWAGRMGGAGRPLAAVAISAEERVAPVVRRRPVTAAGCVAVAFAIALALASSREDGPSPVIVLVGAVGACAMFAFVVAGGAWLGLVATAPSTNGHRRLVRAAVVGAAAVPASLAFRDAIWTATGTGGDRDLVALAALVAAAGVATFLSVLLLSAVHQR